MEVRENPRFTEDYYAADKRYIGNAVQVFFKDGSHTDRVAVDFPIGHRKRRAEGIPVLVRKFQAAVDANFGGKQAERIKSLFARPAALDTLPVNELMATLVTNGAPAAPASASA
jgi:2-methylcitrate dehydratase